MNFRFVLAALAAMVAVHSPAHEQHHHHDDEGHRQHGAHVHGEGLLTLVTEDPLVLVELTSPAYNLLGFEQTPRDDKQRATVREALDTLENLNELVTFPSGCRQLESAVQSPDWAEAHAEAHGHAKPHGHDDHAPQHADFVASYRLECSHAIDLRGLGFPIFDRFPAFDTLRVQWLLDDGSGAGVVTPSQPRLR